MKNCKSNFNAKGLCKKKAGYFFYPILEAKLSVTSQNLLSKLTSKRHGPTSTHVDRAKPEER